MASIHIFYLNCYVPKLLLYRINLRPIHVVSTCPLALLPFIFTTVNLWIFFIIPYTAVLPLLNFDRRFLATRPSQPPHLNITMSFSEARVIYQPKVMMTFAVDLLMTYYSLLSFDSISQLGFYLKQQKYVWRERAISIWMRNQVMDQIVKISVLQ